jgi:glycosyltransferase involved in cell wall biosynthesis
MKILIINTSDKSGGAARACWRVFSGLQKKNNLDVDLIVKNKISNNGHVFTENNIWKKRIAQVKRVLDFLISKLLKTENKVIHSPAVFSSLNLSKIKEINPDIIHLHWICGGFVSVKDIKKLSELGKPIIWTLHDMWAFCGAEHYAKDTQRYIDGYNDKNRPIFERGFDLNKWTWERKFEQWKDLNLTIVTPSRWLANCAKKSRLIRKNRVEVIPNGIDVKIFEPKNKEVARDELNLPKNKKLVLFGAMNATDDPRKGFEYFKKATKNLSRNKKNKDIELVVFGSSKPEKEVDLGFKINYLGKINSETKLALIYSAVNVFVTPSLEDNLPNTIMESLSCGNPCVGFNVGGIPDMIDHEKNGYLAEYKNAEDLARGIEWVLNNDEYDNLCKNSRNKVTKNFDLKIIAERYSKLYKEVLK